MQCFLWLAQMLHPEPTCRAGQSGRAPQPGPGQGREREVAEDGHGTSATFLQTRFHQMSSSCDIRKDEEC